MRTSLQTRKWRSGSHQVRPKLSRNASPKLPLNLRITTTSGLWQESHYTLRLGKAAVWGECRGASMAHQVMSREDTGIRSLGQVCQFRMPKPIFENHSSSVSTQISIYTFILFLVHRGRIADTILVGSELKLRTRERPFFPILSQPSRILAINKHSSDNLTWT